MVCYVQVRFLSFPLQHAVAPQSAKLLPCVYLVECGVVVCSLRHHFLAIPINKPMRTFFNKILHRDYLQALPLAERMAEIGITTADVAEIMQIANPNFVERYINGGMRGDAKYTRSQEWTDIVRVVNELVEIHLTKHYDNKPATKPRQYYIPLPEIA